MSCAKGCCATQREHYLSVGRLSADRGEWTKTTTHQTKPNTSVDVTQHFDGRQDVTVHAPRLVAKANVEEVG
jgi:hypothetical protein